MNDAPTFHEFFANWPIFRDAVATGTLAGALLGFLGVQIVLRRMVFASSAIAQAAALGVALSFWVPAVIDPVGHAARHAADPSAHIVPLLFEPVLWALGASLLATLAFIFNPVRLHLTRESVLGVVFLAGAAGSVIIGDRITQESHDLAAILFGSAVVVERSDLVLVSIATVVVLAVHVALWRPLIFVAFDPIGARVQGLPVRSLDLFVFLAVGVAVALCTRALGALPVFAFSVLPAMAALALTSNLVVAFALATGIGALSGGAGYAVSFRGELPVGATQSAVALGILAAALARSGIVGLLKRKAGAPNSVAIVLLSLSVLAPAVMGGCIGGRFDVADPSTEPDQLARVVVERIAADRAATALPPGDWVPDLRVPASAAARAIARGEESPASAAHMAATRGVTALGRHIWAFAADCTDLHRFRPPPLVIQHRTLLFGAAAVPGRSGHIAVLLLVAEPGPSALRADQMGGGRGGSNPTLETYVHGAVATGPCGERWPSVQRAPL